MERSASYYSSSLLSAYLTDSESLTDQKPIPEINVFGPGYTEDSVEGKDLVLKNKRIESEFYDTSLNTRNSRISSASTVMSLRSSVSEMSDDLDLQSVRLNLENLDSGKQRVNKFKKLKQRILREEKPSEPSSDDERFFTYVIGKLTTQYYQYERKTTLNVQWENAAEVFFFGDTIDHLFSDKTHLLNYLMESSYELGEVKFSNLSRYHTDRNYDVPTLLKEFIPSLERFNGVLDLYAESDMNIERPELFEVFSSQANHYDGLCIPLAISMFGNWLLSYNKDKSLASNYENTLIVDYFRKAARLALVLRKVKSFLEENAGKFDKATLIILNRYWSRDNQNALSTSLHGLGEYYQFIHNYDAAVTLWELNCHLTEDAELGHLAILGLTDGFGLGNHSKEHNRFGKRSRTNKFNTKRRIAHLYRILMKHPSFDEYGVSWATKEKYD